MTSTSIFNSTRRRGALTALGGYDSPFFEWKPEHAQRTCRSVRIAPLFAEVISVDRAQDLQTRSEVLRTRHAALVSKKRGAVSPLRTGLTSSARTVLASGSLDRTRRARGGRGRTPMSRPLNSTGRLRGGAEKDGGQQDLRMARTSLIYRGSFRSRQSSKAQLSRAPGRR